MSVLDRMKKDKFIKDNIFVDRPKEYISTGSIPLNILFSGRVDGGIQKRRMMQIVAPSALGKSFIGMKVAKSAQKLGMDVIIVDTEFAYDQDFAIKVGLDINKMIVLQNNRIEEVQRLVLTSMEGATIEERDNTLIIIDSWGSLVTSKGLDDALSGKDVRDMTKAQKKNEFSKQMLGLKTTIFVINQTYETMNQYDPLAVGGGLGLFYSCTSIVMGTSKAKDKDSSGEINGVIISATTKKGRGVKEFTKLKYLIEHEGGIHPYYGIMDDAIEGGYIVKPTMGFYSRTCVEGDKKWRESEIWANAEVFWEPVLKDTDFMEFIKNKYTFSADITDVNFDFNNIGSISKQEINRIAKMLEDENAEVSEE